jgi:hypothetical protein
MKKLLLLVLSILSIAIVGCGGQKVVYVTKTTETKTEAAQDDSGEKCFVTGSGEELCDKAAAAYCRIHIYDYLYDGSFSSLDACEAVGVKPDPEIEREHYKADEIAVRESCKYETTDSFMRGTCRDLGYKVPPKKR